MAHLPSSAIPARLEHSSFLGDAAKLSLVAPSARTFLMQGDFSGSGKRRLLLLRELSLCYLATLVDDQGQEMSGRLFRVTEGWEPYMACDVDSDGRHELLWKHSQGAIAVSRVHGTDECNDPETIFSITRLFAPLSAFPFSVQPAEDGLCRSLGPEAVEGCA